MTCDIIIPIWDQLTFTKDCIEHIRKNTAYPYRLILIDNASGPEARAYLEGLRDEGRGKLAVERRGLAKGGRDDCGGVVLIRNEENLGYVKAINQGLKISDAPYVCMMNNDTIPASGWLEKMIAFAEVHKDVGLVNPQCNGHLNTPIESYARALWKNKGKYMEMNQCQGFCMLVKRELIDKVGFLDEAYGIGGYDDTDYSMRAHLAGYRSVAIYDAYVYHRLHVSFDKAGDREEWVRKNRKLFYDKWGKHLRLGMIVSLGDIRQDAIARMVRMAYGLAREWAWVHVWINLKGESRALSASIDEQIEREGFAPHQNIRFDYFGIPPFLFGAALSGKLIERMRKRMRDKRFDAIISVDGSATAGLKRTARFTGVGVIDAGGANAQADWLREGREIALSIKKNRGSGAV